MKKTLTIPNSYYGGRVDDDSRHRTARVSIEAPPWGELDTADRSETAPRHRRLVTQPRRDHPAVAAIRAEWQAMREAAQ